MTKGDRIRYARENCKLTQEDLAQKLNTTKQTIHKYESGLITNIPSEKIELMAKIFNLSPAYLMGWEEDKTPESPKIVAAFGGGTTDSEKRINEILKDKQELCQLILAANINKTQIKTLKAMVKVLEEI
mgnify:FL=1